LIIDINDIDITLGEAILKDGERVGYVTPKTTRKILTWRIRLFSLTVVYEAGMIPFRRFAVVEEKPKNAGFVLERRN